MPLSAQAATLQFYSTNGKAPLVDLKEALLSGQAPDRGLYMPSRIPSIAPGELEALRGLNYAALAAEILGRFTVGVVERDSLGALCADAYDWETPLERANDRVHIMRLDRGPTASFKDFAARMMARLMGRFLAEQGRGLTILTATSGDTGSAVAHAFHHIENIQVVVLYPRGEVSDRQRRQMTTLGGNIRAIEIEGKFDDCQALVKRAFADDDLKGLDLSSANSINIGRLLPQSVYYFWAWARVAGPGEKITVAVPSGNFGNMMGCLLAWRMGLPVARLVVPVNENDEFPRFLATEDYEKVEPSRACISNAMNVGHPSNLARLVDLYGGWIDESGIVHRHPDYNAMRRDLFSVAVSDDETRAAIRHAWERHGVLLEPHGAVGWSGLQSYLKEHSLEGMPAVVVETAHPAKFPDEIERVLGIVPDVPASLARLDDATEEFDTLPADYETFRDFLLERY